METLITIIHILAALFMVLVIIIQGGNAGGVGAAFGGGNSQGVFGATGAQNILGKLTYVVAGIFMVTSLSLSVIQGHSGKTGLTDRLEQAASQQQAELAQTTPEEAVKAPTESKDTEEVPAADPKK